MTWASSAPRRAWKLRSAMLSPRYTTAWEDVLIVKDGSAGPRINRGLPVADLQQVRTLQLR